MEVRSHKMNTKVFGAASPLYIPLNPPYQRGTSNIKASIRTVSYQL